jgi:hypothetical protein
MDPVAWSKVSLRICPMRSSTHLNSILIYNFLFFGHANRSNLLALYSLMIFHVYKLETTVLDFGSIKQFGTRLNRVSGIDTAANQDKQVWRQPWAGRSLVPYSTRPRRLLLKETRQRRPSATYRSLRRIVSVMAPLPRVSSTCCSNLTPCDVACAALLGSPTRCPAPLIFLAPMWARETRRLLLHGSRVENREDYTSCFSFSWIPPYASVNLLMCLFTSCIRRN